MRTIGSEPHIRIVVTGSRDFTDGDLAQQALTAAVNLHDFPLNPVLVHGAARGLDTVAAEAATRLGWGTEAHPADWSKHGGCWCKDTSRRCGFAGHRRNNEMIDIGAELVVAFPMHPLVTPESHATAGGKPKQPGSRGTWHCAQAAKKAGLPVLVLWQNHLHPYGDAALEFTPGPVNITTGSVWAP